MGRTSVQRRLQNAGKCVKDKGKERQKGQAELDLCMRVLLRTGSWEVGKDFQGLVKAWTATRAKGEAT